MPNGAFREHIRPDRAERRVRLVSAIARGRRWLDEIISGSITDAEQLAKRKRCTVRQINLTLSLAFLSPQLVKAAVDGRWKRIETVTREQFDAFERQDREIRMEERRERAMQLRLPTALANNGS